MQTLSRAFSIMQIESDWLRSGFSTAVLSFRAPEFSPRYASYPLSTLSPTPLVSPLLSPRIRPSMFDQRDQRAPRYRESSIRPAAQLPVAELFARPHGIIEKFRWPFGFVDIHSQINARRSGRGGAGKEIRGGGGEMRGAKQENSSSCRQNFVHRETALVVV